MTVNGLISFCSSDDQKRKARLRIGWTRVTRRTENGTNEKRKINEDDHLVASQEFSNLTDSSWDGMEKQTRASWTTQYCISWPNWSWREKRRDGGDYQERNHDLKGRCMTGIWWYGLMYSRKRKRRRCRRDGKTMYKWWKNDFHIQRIVHLWLGGWVVEGVVYYRIMLNFMCFQSSPLSASPASTSASLPLFSSDMPMSETLSEQAKGFSSKVAVPSPDFLAPLAERTLVGMAQVASDSSLVTLMAELSVWTEVSIWLPPVPVVLFFRDSVEFRLHSISCFFHLVLKNSGQLWQNYLPKTYLRFWNHVLIWTSERLSAQESSIRLLTVRYLSFCVKKFV